VAQRRWFEKAKKISSQQRQWGPSKKNCFELQGRSFILTICFKDSSCILMYQRKTAKTNKPKAYRALANKLSKACYFIMRDGMAFDVNKLFQN